LLFAQLDLGGPAGCFDERAEMNPQEIAARTIDTGPSALGTESPWQVQAEALLMQERTRTGFACVLLALLFAIVFTSFLAYGTRWGDVEGMANFVELSFAPVIGLLGSVVGFYYGQQAGSA